MAANQPPRERPQIEPQLPSELFVHTRVSSFSTVPADLSGTIARECEIPAAPLGARVSICRYKEGLLLFGLTPKGFTIHFSQVVACQFLEALKIKTKGKSVVGRALLGGIILGPVGAVVGGMSGVGKTEQQLDGLQLTYWDTGPKRYDTLVIESKHWGLREFCEEVTKRSVPYRDLHSAALR